VDEEWISQVELRIMSSSLLSLYGFDQEKIHVTGFGNGLINRTWKVHVEGKDYILQRINEKVFKEPEKIARNHRLLADHLKLQHPGYHFVEPLSTTDGRELVYWKSEGYYRLFPFVEGSHSKDVAETEQHAYEAARQFGRFTRLLSDLDSAVIHSSIPSFHDLTLRFNQFGQSLKEGDSNRIQQCADLIRKALDYQYIADQYARIKNDPAFPLRIMHHDTKISNVLFDQNDRGICVIDLDTVMPGYFISDLGDMMRTYLSPVSEEESDFNKIEIRSSFYEAVTEGYSAEMNSVLSPAEQENYLYAGKFMIYMQALRFLTDYLLLDRYYGSLYEGHNRVRAGNQFRLLESLIQKEPELKRQKV
jgi:Ser/Thr protein kinase RdoA (MazF antagonist)